MPPRATFATAPTATGVDTPAPAPRTYHIHRKRPPTPLLVGLALLALTACRGPEHLLDPDGIQAARIASLFWFALAISTAVYVAVLVALAVAARNGRRRASIDPSRAPEHPEAAHPEGERRATRLVTIAVGATVVLLFVYLLATFRTGRALAALATDPGPEPLTVTVIGHQWWWELRYQDPQANRNLTTANELHVPVGRTVLVKGESQDVIHSFWVPNFHGKRDLIPGYTQTGWFRADTAGTYFGQCAEYCGMQHAKMRLTVVAQPPEEFDRWYAAQLRDAAEPATPSARRGKEVFLTNGCVLCHQVRGTPAGSHVGPDLTHFASRSSIAAGTLPNTRGHLAGWVMDPQRIKPGARMPPQSLSSGELNAVLDYLRSLK